ncbi:hypothetical protein AAP_03418 [Ascosphaera apis ARSEF 7405]|uniref:Uncharacterized protein n=1 Tax=Ascosphaera apis ARSEF 7405 TaxID=392613 RepID=A0A167YET3_9EURO|nr:hypothetical protein AAP_03418 [Ascosphaera apis ARSEF 7405]
MDQALQTTRRLGNVVVSSLADTTGVNLYRIYDHVNQIYSSLPSKEQFTALPILYKRFFEIDVSYLIKILGIDRHAMHGHLFRLSPDEERLLNETAKSRVEVLIRLLFVMPIIQAVAMMFGHRIPLKYVFILWTLFFYVIYRIISTPCKPHGNNIQDSPDSKLSSEGDYRDDDSDGDSTFTGIKQLFDESNGSGAS